MEESKGRDRGRQKTSDQQIALGAKRSETNGLKSTRICRSSRRSKIMLWALGRGRLMWWGVCNSVHRPCRMEKRVGCQSYPDPHRGHASVSCAEGQTDRRSAALHPLYFLWLAPQEKRLAGETRGSCGIVAGCSNRRDIWRLTYLESWRAVGQTGASIHVRPRC